MTRRRFVLSATLLATLALLTVAPVASAETSAFACAHLGSGGGGLVGRTIDYVANVEYAACSETLAYAYDVCVFLLGPSPCAIA